MKIARSIAMENMKLNIKSADIDSAMKITNLLYQLIDSKKLESVKIKQVKKGKKLDRR